jgi:hypothetical protein
VTDRRQAKLRSVDNLLVILTRLGLCSETKALRIFQHYRHEIFYRYGSMSGIDSKLDAKK